MDFSWDQVFDRNKETSSLTCLFLFLSCLLLLQPADFATKLKTNPVKLAAAKLISVLIWSQALKCVSRKS